MTREAQIEEVHIGQVKLADPNAGLRALLGSCVGIALLNRRRGQCTLCHCLLPSAPEITDELNGRWVDQAIHSSLKLLESAVVGRRHLEAIVAGGGNIVGLTGNSKVKVGDSNVAVARTMLEHLKIPVIKEDVGGEQSRQLIVWGDTLEYEIRVIPKLESPAAPAVPTRRRKRHG